jgi:hypothetical protein
LDTGFVTLDSTVNTLPSLFRRESRKIVGPMFAENSPARDLEIQ